MAWYGPLLSLSSWALACQDNSDVVVLYVPMQNSTETVRAYLSTSEVASYTGLKPVTLELWRRKGRGPIFIKAGRRVLYKITDVENWLTERRQGGGQ